MGIGLAKRYAQYYMDVGKVKVGKVTRSLGCDEGGDSKEEIVGYVAKMSEPLKVLGFKEATKEAAVRSLGALVAQEVALMLAARKSMPVDLPMAESGRGYTR